MNLHNAEFIRSAAAPKDLLADGLPQIAFAGRSNVGKSSVINRLLGRKNFARVGAAPGKTTHVNYFRIDDRFYLVDLPGYGYARVSQGEKERWARLMESYFARPERITLGVLVVDARHRPTADDRQMADWFRGTGRPFVVAANKVDKVKPSALTESLDLVRSVLEAPELIAFSAEMGTGRDDLLARVLTAAGAEAGSSRPGS